MQLKHLFSKLSKIYFERIKLIGMMSNWMILKVIFNEGGIKIVKMRDRQKLSIKKEGKGRGTLSSDVTL